MMMMIFAADGVTRTSYIVRTNRDQSSRWTPRFGMRPVRARTLASLAALLWLCAVGATAPEDAMGSEGDACPSVCFCDETNYVNCVGDGLWDVPSDLPRATSRLELRSYAIGTLSVGALRGVVALSELKLQQTQIRSIEGGAFGNLTRLLRLDLSQNLVERVSSAMFEGLPRLRYLDLSSNRVRDTDDAFVDLVSLEQLNLRDNLLPRLTARSFTGLHKVQYLNLDANAIASVDVGTFQYLTNLAHLIVSNNPLTALSRLDFFGSRLQYIDVSRVGLRRVPQSLTRYVRDLRLAKNNLTHVRLGDFDSYPYLSLLVLDDNRLTDIDSDALGRQEYLLRLWLNGNRLTRIPANLPPSLRVLYVEENRLGALAARSFQGLFALEQLFLQRNQIRRLDACAFCDLLNLRHLDLQANLLEAIREGAFANLSGLVSLDLSQNPLKTLPAGCFAGLDGLRTLQLSRTKTPVLVDGSAFGPLKRLDTLDVYDSPALAGQLVNSTRLLQGMRSVRELNLMHNNLAALRSDFPDFFPQLKVAKLSGNLWRCDRRILWLAAWIKRAGTHFHHSYGIRCSEPSALLYKPIMMLKEDDFALAPTTAAAVAIVPSSMTTTASTPTMTTSTRSTFPAFFLTSAPKDGVSAAATPPQSASTVPPESEQSVNISDSSAATPEWDPSADNDSSAGPPEATTSTFNESLAMAVSEAATSRSNASAAALPEMSTTAATASSTTLTSDPSNETTTVTSTSDPPVGDPPLNDTGVAYVTARESADSTTGASASASTANQSWTPAVVVGATETLQSTAPPRLATVPEERENSLAASGSSGNSSRDAGFGKNSSVLDLQLDEHDGMVVAAASVATGLGLLLVGLTMTVVLFRCRKGYYSVTGPTAGCQMRRSSSSISYSPQRDEVSIVTVSEGTVGLHTLTHQGLSNKLYFVLENGADPSSRDLVKDALPDPSLQELLPDAYSTAVHRPGSRKAPKRRTSSTYCFT